MVFRAKGKLLKRGREEHLDMGGDWHRVMGITIHVWEQASLFALWSEVQLLWDSKQEMAPEGKWIEMRL